eukprot:1159203-Pelagomonas_calceolata.AAC.12
MNASETVLECSKCFRSLEEATCLEVKTYLVCDVKELRCLKFTVAGRQETLDPRHLKIKVHSGTIAKYQACLVDSN